jgi:tripartite-type tricarboxylate transporter receptor subunit TctC
MKSDGIVPSREASSRRSAMRLILALLAAVLLTAAPAQAQQYPDRVIKLVVPFVPGSPVDVLARVVSQQMTARLGQSVVVENRPGAGTSTATKQVQSSPPDGYTLLLSGQNLVYVGLLYPDIGFDPVKSFVPVATLAGWSHVLLVANDVPAKSVKELVAHAKANPGKVTFGYGLGTSPQIVGKSFELAAGLQLINVPYKGGEQVRVDLLGGRIHINFAPVSNALPMIQAGKVRALAVTGATRDPALPDVPTFKESGFPTVGFHPDVWQAIIAPLCTPFLIIDKANTEIYAALRSDEVQGTFKKLRFQPMIMSPQEFAKLITVQAERWPPIIKATGLKAQ